MRADPVDDEIASLVVELGDADQSQLTAALCGLSGTVDRELQFDCYLIELPETAVPKLCELKGVARIETADTLGVNLRDSELLTEPAGEPADSAVDSAAADKAAETDETSADR